MNIIFCKIVYDLNCQWFLKEQSKKKIIESEWQ